MNELTTNGNRRPVLIGVVLLLCKTRYMSVWW